MRLNNGILSGIGGLISIATSFLTVAFSTQMYSPAEYGVYALYQAWAAFASVFALLGMPKMIIATKDHGSSFCIAAINYQLPFSLLSGALFAASFLLVSPGSILKYLPIVFIGFSMKTIALSCEAILTSRGDFSEILKYKSIKFFLLLAIAIPSGYVSRSIVVFFVATLVSELIAAAKLVRVVMPTGRESKYRLGQNDKSFLFYMSAVSSIAVISSFIDRILIERWFSLELLAIFTIAIQLISIFDGVLQSYAMPRSLEISRHVRSEHEYLIEVLRWVFSGVAIFVMISGVLFFFIPVFFGDEYKNVWLLFVCGGGRVALAMAARLNSSLLTMSRDKGFQLIVSILDPGTRIVSMPFFIHFFGLKSIIFYSLFDIVFFVITLLRCLKIVKTRVDQ
jgi:O-antigen/teichoic acid export membrane protein